MMDVNLGSVLQVNVRLSEGGAAGVARMLASELSARGIESPIAYGYSRRGRSSPLENSANGLRLTPAWIAAANLASFYVRGDETGMLSRQHWEAFRQAVERSDVVHFHAVHSHIARVADLVNVVLEFGRPLVWTMHDQWHFTGRCAQPGKCRRWEDGCRECPDLNAYPPAIVDRAATHWPIRRELLREIESQVPFALVACAKWLEAEAIKADLPCVSRVTNSVDREFWVAATAGALGRRSHPQRRLLFACRDLRDRNKVDWGTLRAIASIPDVQLTIVGDHAPEPIEAAQMVPAVSDRRTLAELMRERDALVFLSTVDYFPLTLAEAITSGLGIYAVESQAAREFEDAPGMRILPSKNDLIQAVKMDATSSGRASLDPTYRERFSPSVMVDSYCEIYKRLLEGRMCK